MKFQLYKKWILIITFFLGLGLILLAVLAYQLGIDHNATWAGKRIFTLAMGILLSFSSLFMLKAGRYINWVKGQFFFLDSDPTLLFSGLCILFVIVAYIWFVSIGQWTVWPATSSYYDQLATAFRNGQLNINTHLNPALSKLPNPYDPEAREAIPGLDKKGLDNIWDMSFYNGKIYIYFGAAPALLLTFVKFIYLGQIGDQTLGFVFIAGLFIFESLLIYSLWRRYFFNLPGWTVILSILIIGLAHPVPWTLIESRIYETAIAAGQFFFIGGFYFAFIGLNRSKESIWPWILAGTLWALAVGTRALLVIPVLFVSIIIILWMVNIYYKTGRVFRNFYLSFLAMTLPMVIGAIIIGWYDWARFGSVFEAGLRYQIGMSDLNTYNGDIFTLAHIPPNLFIYIFNPPAISGVFPFIRSIRADEVISNFNNSSLQMYNSERITGILLSTPFTILAIIPAVTGVANLFLKWQNQDSNEGNRNDQRRFQWIVLSLFGCTVLILISLLLYFYGTVRYILEIIPSALILSIIGFWQGYQFLGKKPFLHVLYSILSIGLASASILAGVLLSFSSDTQRIRLNNPSLLPHLILFFIKLTRKFGV